MTSFWERRKNVLNHIDLCEYPEANRIGSEDTFSLCRTRNSNTKRKKSFLRLVLKRNDYGILKISSLLHFQLWKFLFNKEIASWHLKFSIIKLITARSDKDKKKKLCHENLWLQSFMVVVQRPYKYLHCFLILNFVLK